MSEILKGCGTVAIAVGCGWIFILLSTVSPSLHNYATAIGALVMLPPPVVIGVGLFFIATGMALDRLREIRDAAREALQYLRSEAGKGAP